MLTILSLVWAIAGGAFVYRAFGALARGPARPAAALRLRLAAAIAAPLVAWVAGGLLWAALTYDGSWEWLGEAMTVTRPQYLRNFMFLYLSSSLPLLVVYPFAIIVATSRARARFGGGVGAPGSGAGSVSP